MKTWGIAKENINNHWEGNPFFFFFLNEALGSVPFPNPNHFHTAASRDGQQRLGSTGFSAYASGFGLGVMMFVCALDTDEK